MDLLCQNLSAGDSKSYDVNPLDQKLARSPSTNSDLTDKCQLSITYLPGRIANALVMIYEGLRNFDLLENHRRVLACLVRFGVNSKTPSANIFIKKSTIAKYVGVNEATVYRSLSILEDCGLIERDEQVREGRNLKTIAYIRLTKKAIDSLALDHDAENHRAEGGPQTAATFTESDDRVNPGIASQLGLAPVQDVNGKHKQSSMKKQPRRGPFCKIDGRTIPSELAWLALDNALSATGILALMTEAKRHGTMLSTVVEHAYDALKEIRGRELFAYLKSLLGKPVDFDAAVVAKRAKAEAVVAEKTAVAAFQATIEKIKQATGKTYTDPSNGSWTVEEGGFYVRGNGSTGSVPFAQARDAIVAILDGRWLLADRDRNAGDKPTSIRAVTEQTRTALDSLRTLTRSFRR